MTTTKIIHHVNKDFTHEVIETQTLRFGFVIKSEMSNAKLI